MTPDPVRDHPAGTLLIVPGPASELYRLHRGLVRVHAVDAGGDSLTLRYVKPGGFFGEEALVGGARTVFAEAVTDVAVEVLDPSALPPEVHGELSVHLADAMDWLYRALHRNATKRLRARVAADLLALRDSALAEVDDGVPVVRITHDELAASVGSVRETVTKVVGELARLGALESGYGRIRLRDEARLRVEADG